MIILNDHQQAIFSKATIEPTTFLGYRDLPKYIQQFNMHKSKVLDLGCGPAARSTMFLDKFCDEVIACDMSYNTVNFCQNNYEQTFFFNEKSTGKYRHYPFSIIFSIFSFCRFAYEKELLAQFMRCYESLTNGGSLIIVSGSENLYTKEFSSIKPHVYTNETLNPGKKVGINIKSIDCDIFDFYWPSNILINLAKEVGFELVALLYPRGHKQLDFGHRLNMMNPQRDLI